MRSKPSTGARSISPTPLQAEAHARLRRVLDYTHDALDAVDPELVSFAALEAVATHLDNVTTYMQQFAASPDLLHLDNANGQADAILLQLAALLPPTTTKEVEGLQAAVTSFRRSIGQHARNVDEELGATRTTAGQIDERLTAQGEKVEAAHRQRPH